jgi:hypothetical protein
VLSPNKAEDDLYVKRIHHPSPSTPKIPDDDDWEREQEYNSAQRIEKVFRKWKREEEKKFSEVNFFNIELK